jgi:type IV pilus assembly protein PilY1
VGLSFSSLDDRYRVGFMIITFANDTSAVTCTYDKLTLTAPPCPTGTEFVPIDAFIPAQKQAFFNAMYSQIPAHGTPLRQALTRAGRYFAGLSSGISAGLTPDPVQYSCQQNFALLTTDGMWKDYPVDGDGAKLDGTPVGNQDNDLSDPSGVVSRAAGTFDGNCPAGDVTKSPGGCANTLADVAMYYYKTDLRTPALGNATGALGQDVSANNVPTTPTDPANWQHMTTFTLALADGLMNWQPDYATASTGDFKNIATGASGCWWSGSSACNWPSVVADTPTALDDLWHAAVNGHGQYFHAGDAQSLTAGLTGALAGMSARTAAASASATSSPNITQQDNVIYSTTYQTVNWTGQLVAQYIDTTTGNVLPGILWQAQQSLDALTGQTSDSRKIYTSGAFGGLRDFTYSNLDSTARNWLDNVCNTPGKLSQCASGVLSGSQISWLNTGENLVNFIRGWSQNEGIILRDRSHALGDTVDATPVYVRAPIFSFNDVGYNDFKRQQASRRQMIYLAANDGMLHAIDATVGTNSGGQEVWAYVPRMLIPNLYRLADINYPSRHTFFVDGSPSVMDAYINGSWRTVLVGGLNSGGRGYYALDITDPAQPQALWEFCSDATVCVQSDKSLGYSYGNPVITKLPSGRWVVLLTSGYNNVNPGDGQPHLFVRDLATGSPVADLTPSTTVTATSPVGLGCIAAWSEDFVHNNTAQYAYGGDLAGNLWRFDFTGSTPRMTKMGFLTDGNHRPQSITTRPELGLVNSQYRVVFVGTGRYLGLSDLTDPATWPQPSTDAWQQSFYAVKDTGGNLGEIRFSGGLVAQTLLPIGTQNRTTTANLVNWSDPAVNGWYVDFNPGNASPGERVNVDPVLVMGTLNIKTNVPSMNACTFGGESWVYQFRFDTGAYVSTAPGQIAGQRIDGATTVGFVIVGLPGGGLKDITTTATGEKRTFGVNIGASANGGRRIGWRELTP